METVHLLAGHSGVEDLSVALRRLQQDRWICWDQDRNTLDLHPIVRRYAYAQLEKREAVHELLAEHLASKARGVVIQQNTAEPSGRLRRYAQPGAVRAEHWPARPAEVELLVELYYQLVKAGRSNAALSLYREHLAGQLYDRLGLYGVCVELLDTLIDADSGTLRPASAASAIQVWMLNELANAYAAVGQARQATHIYRDAIDMCRNDRLGEAEAVIWANLAYQQVNLGELQEAYSNLRKSLDGCQRGGDRVNEAIGYQDLARIWAYQGSFSRAEQASGAAERVATHLPRGQRPELLLFFRGLAALLSGQIRTGAERAREEYCRSRNEINEAHIVGANWLLGWSLTSLAAAERDQRDAHLAEADVHLSEALRGALRIKLTEIEPDILLARARWQRETGDVEEARHFTKEALRIADRCGYRLKLADIHNFLADLDLAVGALNSAREHAEAASELARCDGPPHCYEAAHKESERLLRVINLM